LGCEDLLSELAIYLATLIICHFVDISQLSQECQGISVVPDGSHFDVLIWLKPWFLRSVIYKGSVLLRLCITCSPIKEHFLYILSFHCLFYIFSYVFFKDLFQEVFRLGPPVYFMNWLNSVEVMNVVSALLASICPSVPHHSQVLVV
jgi:hypothetical protein